VFVAPPQPPHGTHGNQRNSRKGGRGGEMEVLLFLYGVRGGDCGLPRRGGLSRASPGAKRKGLATRRGGGLDAESGRPQLRRGPLGPLAEQISDLRPRLCLASRPAVEISHVLRPPPVACKPKACVPPQMGFAHLGFPDSPPLFSSSPYASPLGGEAFEYAHCRFSPPFSGGLDAESGQP